MIRQWLKSFARKRATRQGIALEQLLGLPPTAHAAERLLPIVVPVSFIDAGWPGPIEPIGALPFAVAWANLYEGNRWVYVTDELVAHWAEHEVDWRAEAFRNLRRKNEAGGYGYKEDADGRPFLRVMLQEDAAGPSRLLLPHLFDHELGPGYKVAIPERTCAIAYRTSLTAEQQADVDAMIDGCFEHGTEPVSPERFDAADFWGIARRYEAAEDRSETA